MGLSDQPGIRPSSSEPLGGPSVALPGGGVPTRTGALVYTETPAPGAPSSGNQSPSAPPGGKRK